MEKNTVFYAFKYDIKEFFTNVVIAHVMPALQFFIYNNSVIKQGHIWMHKRNFKLVFIAKPLLENSFYKLDIQQIIDLISYDMNNAWFKLGNSLIGKQKEGLSIGGFLSSMLAIMLANYAEHSTITSSLYGSKFFHKNSQILDGLRATDDGLIFIAIDQKLIIASDQRLTY